MASKKGAVGIGTLIIFIAMVLVAAIAAAVLINVSGILQQRAMKTGKEAISQVSGNLLVSSIMGTTNPGMSNIENFTVFVSAAAGAGRTDLSTLVLRVGNNFNQSTLKYSNTTTVADSFFNITEVRDPTNLFTPQAPVIDGSSLVQINVVPSATVYFPTRSQYRIELIPEFGAPTAIEGVTPSSYSTTLQNIYP